MFGLALADTIPVRITNTMRTRAIFNCLLSCLILVALAMLDLVAHSYPEFSGAVFEAIRAIIQGMSLLFVTRGIQTLFFSTPPDAQPGTTPALAERPIRLLRNFVPVLFVSAALAWAPRLFNISINKQGAPSTFASVISVDILGWFWLMMLVALWLSFWRLVFIRQLTKTARRRFGAWATVVAITAAIAFFIDLAVVPNTFVSQTVQWIAVLGVALGATLLGYRLPWLPHLDRSGKRQLLVLSAINSLLAFTGLLFFFASRSEAATLFYHYAPFWHAIAVALFITLAIYFALVFFSGLFSLSSTALVERKSAEVESLAKLTRFSADVLSSELLLDYPRLANQIIELAQAATESDAAWLELLTPDPGRMDPVMIPSYRGISVESAERIMRYTDGIEAAASSPPISLREIVQRTHKPYVVSLRKGVSSSISDESDDEFSDRTFYSAVAIPLVRNNEVRGGLYVVKEQEQGFDEDDLTVLNAFCDVALLALETARLLQDSIEKQKIDGELRAARTVQLSLLPKNAPKIDGYELATDSTPAYDVGGDFFDFSALWDGSAMLTIGDVSGKGVGASIYMAETKGIIQSLAPIMSNTLELLERMNTVLLQNAPHHSTFKRSFVTLGLLAFHGESLRYCRAGHTPLLLVHASGEYEYLQPRGMAVGMMPQSVFTQSLEDIELELHEGDTLVLYSDGITEARPRGGEEFGYERLAMLVSSQRHEPARSIINAVINEIINYTQSERFGDDATLVVIKRTTPTQGNYGT